MTAIPSDAARARFQTAEVSMDQRSAPASDVHGTISKSVVSRHVLIFSPLSHYYRTTISSTKSQAGLPAAGCQPGSLPTDSARNLT